MLPELGRTRKNTTQIDVFRGLNRTVNTGFSRVGTNSTAIFIEFKDMTNLCSDDYPRLRTRKERSRIYEEGQAAIVSNIIAVNSKLIFIDGNGKLHFDGTLYTVTGFTAGEHTITQYGNNVIIMPEKLYFNLSSKTFENIEVSIELTSPRFFPNNTSITQDDIQYLTKCSIEKIELDDYGKPRKAAFKLLTGIDLSDINHQLPVDNSGNYKYTYLFYNVHEGETVEAMGSAPGALYKCYSVEGKNGYNSDNKARYFIHSNQYYIKINMSNLNRGQINKLKAIKKGDYVKLSNMAHYISMDGQNMDTSQALLADLAYDGYIDVLNNQYFKIYACHSEVTQTSGASQTGEAWIVIKANIECSIPYSGPMTIERVMPPIDDDKLIEVNNRLWSCSSSANEIYCCKQGDCTNWQAYGDGISTDSFAATIGCEGDFTGIARQNDSVIFFKENWIIKLYGNKPSNYQTAMFNVLGVEKGSGKSLVWVNGVLFYLSPMGVCQYSPGGQPVVISKAAFGDGKYKNGVAGRHKNKYIISAQNENGGYEMFVYDTQSGMWHKEDGTQMRCTVTYNNQMYYIDSKTGLIMCEEKGDNLIENENGFEQEGQFDWSAETADLYDSDFNAKHITKLKIYANVEEHGYFNVLAKFRSKGEWVVLKVVKNEIRGPRDIEVSVRRSRFLRLRLEGVGQCRVNGILIEYEKGSDRVGII